MHSILKRTTALVAVASLPFAPAALAGSETAGQKAAESQVTEAIQPQDILEKSQSQEARDATTADNQMEQPAQRGRDVADQNRAGASAQAEPAQTEAAQTGTAQSDVKDDEIKVYESEEETAPDRARVTKEDGEYIDRSTQDTQEQAGDQAAGQQDDAAGQAAGAEAAEDMTVATVNDRPIRRSDVLAAIESMPAQLQQQPAEMLVPLAIDQLVIRELILQQAREAGLEEDDEVQALAPENATGTARENALVQVWLNRELRDAVSDDKVQEMYDTVAAELGDQAPPLEQVRPQIEQELRRQAFVELSEGLHEDAEVVLYGPQGQPVTVE